MEEFQRQIAKGFIIERVNLTQATIAEAVKFKKHLETDISLGYNIIIIDLSNCNSLDSAFIGVMVVTLKQLMRSGGSIKIVKPGMFSKSMLNLTGTIEIFELYDSLDCAISSITLSAESSSDTLNDLSSNGLDQLAVVH
ncbi:MAG: STAS domain-containing protein [Ignavibacteriaceae bacterium]|nr:STAS domain-containing protein [Ignavibacterium sp.]MCC6256502.1 STAS domain-containing protein [Ignavibacteriaceae bacterium]HMN23302.1 STAS domain-containing protein [Ignavibacteriaceae bacterium]HRN26465.1 STAS domain-containing protein [Ignavibacteriaceae bacterium]HRP92050.1 STAS domain-containing protein [Ignavibacteriaceae bacterium]